MIKKIISYIIVLIIILACCIPLMAIDTDDYRETLFYKTNGDKVFKPTAQFSVIYKGITTESYDGMDEDKINSNLSTVTVNVGDKISISDLSHSNRGKAIKAWDFQLTRPDGTYSIVNNQGFVGEYTMNQVGIYTFSLCVRDTIEDESWTYYWGNWSDNGNHRVVGNNPGRNADDPSDDFNGYWYFTRIVVNVVNNPPNPDFTIEYQGSDITDNKSDPEVFSEDFGLVLRDKSTPFSAAEPITKRTWYYWNVSSGWKEIPYSTDKTTINIASVDTVLAGSGINKAFKLVCKSSTGGMAYKEHTGYFKKEILADYAYTIYYSDVDNPHLDIAPPKEVIVAGPGTYTEAAEPAPANSTLVTPSPVNIVLTSSAPKATFTFYYKFTVPPDPPTSNDPTAILETPEEVMAGAVVKADGSKSFSNNAGGYIADYFFEYSGANLERDSHSNVKIWYPATGTYNVYLQVEDEEGSHDSMENQIKVIPPTPTASFTVSGKLKENRKVTVDSSGSTSTKYYPIDPAKTVWTIAAVSGGTATDIKYSGSITGFAVKELLFKKAGTYKITLKVTNTYGSSDTTSQTITIAQDLPPVARIQLPTAAGEAYKTYRDPGNSNYATAQIFNISYSLDGDTINKAVAFYCYDSDNDSDYKDEQWYYSKDGTTWASTGMNYTNTVSNFNIYSIADSNASLFTLKSKAVGKYYFAVRVMEAIPTADTIPAFITESDYRWDDDF